MPNIVSEKTDTEHSRSLRAKRVVLIDPDDGGALGGDTSPVPVSVVGGSGGGYTPGKIVSSSGTNATSIKSSAGKLGYITASNTNASPRYVKLYNKASAPTVGTDIPVHTFLIPGNTAGAGTNIPLPPQGINLSTGIALAITTGAADSDTGGVSAGEVIINYGFI